MAEYESLHYCKVWTDTAIDCYNRGCKCEGCVLNEIVETRCHMKQAVLELVRKFGAPKKSKLTKMENLVINAILNGADSKYDIAQDLRTKPENIQPYLSRLYKYAQTDGVNFKNPRYKFSQFVDWVRGSYEKL